MATAAATLKGEAIQEQEKLFNFLKKYDLQNYYSKFLQSGVRRLNHLKDVAGDEDSLSEIGLTRVERNRLKTKVKENLSRMGKMMKRFTGKDRQFDAHAPEISRMTVEKEGRRSAAIIPKEEIKKIRQIGEGAHGAVFEGTWADEHGAVAVAIKMLYNRKENQEQFIKEVDSMTTLNHKHIIQLYGIVLSHPLMLVEELAPFGSLHEYVKKEGSKSSLKLLYTYTMQIADAMMYLEERRIVHRDLAIRNVLLAHVDLVKLSDFGMARALDETSDVYKLSNMATKIPVAWTPLEALTHARFSTASDVWSYGVSVWEIYSLGKVPWHGLGPLQIMDTLTAGDRLGRPERCPTDVFELITECWADQPQNRPSFADIYRRLKQLPPRKVRATKACSNHSDNNHLTFKNGELIYIIDRPNSGWVYGMKSNGTCGLLSTDHVSEVLNPLEDIRAKVTAGMNVSDIAIGSPTSVELMVHVRRDGTKWVSENVQESDVRWTPPSTPPMLSSRILDVRSPSPALGLPISPLTDIQTSMEALGNFVLPEPHLDIFADDGSSNNHQDYRDGLSDNNMDFILDRGNEENTLIGVDRSLDDNQILTLDEQYVSMRRTVNADALSPTHSAALIHRALSPTRSAELQSDTPSPTHDIEPHRPVRRSRSDLPQGSKGPSPYVEMQSCSARNLEGIVENKPAVKQRSLTTVSPPPQPLPKPRQRNYASVSTDSTESDATRTTVPPVPLRINVTTESDAAKKVPPRRPPLPKARTNSAMKRKESTASSSESDIREVSDVANSSSSSPPPPLPPTPRARMKDGYEVHMEALPNHTYPRRNSTGPLTSMFNSSFLQNIVGENSPSFSHREKMGLGDRSSVEGSDGSNSPVVTSPMKSKGGVPSHYDVPRSWTSDRLQEIDLLNDDGGEISSNPLLPPPLNPVPTPSPRKSRRHNAASLTSIPSSSSSSSSPSSPSKAEKQKSYLIPEHPGQERESPVIPRRIRLLSTSPSSSPNRMQDSTFADVSYTGQVSLAPNPQYGKFGSKPRDSPDSTAEASSDMDSRYALTPRVYSSSESSSSMLSHYTTLSAVTTTTKSGTDSKPGTLTYQLIQPHSIDKPNDYQSITEYADYSTPSSVFTSGMKEGEPTEAGYQPIAHATRVKPQDYAILDPNNRGLLKSPIPVPAPKDSPRLEAAAAPEEYKLDLDIGRKELKLKVMLSDEEFEECDKDILKFALSHENYDVEHAKHYIRVQHLLGMLLPNITEDDCSKALLHCQQKVDRAALWLMEKSEEIEQEAH